MRRLLFVIAAVALAACAPQSGSAPDEAAMIEGARALDQEFQAAFNRGDAAGVSAVYRCPAGGTRRAVVSGPSLVGVAFLPGGDLVAATADTLYRFPSIP